MENIHEFKTVHDNLFCEEGDIPAILTNPLVINEEKDFFKNVHLVNSYGNEFLTADKKFYNLEDIPACNPENTCEVIQNFLENENVKDRNPPKYEIPACNPHNDCSVIQDFIGEEDGSYDEYLRIKRDSLRSILYEEDRIQELVIKLKEHMLIIKNCKEEIDSAFAKYISTQWQ